MFDDAGSDNVLAVSFKEEAAAYEALSQLKELDSQGQIGVRGAAVVVRQDDGHIVEKDEIADNSLAGTASGGLIGLLVGILGGPLGVLVGGATGLLVGSLWDLDDADDTDSVLSEISKSIRVGPPGLLAHVSEPSPDVIDAAMTRLGGTVLRRSAADVQDEIAAAEEAQRAAKRQARKELRDARNKKQKDEIDAKIAGLKAKLGGHEQSGATTS
jgi:uncharacterized membrane protein